MTAAIAAAAQSNLPSFARKSTATTAPITSSATPAIYTTLTDVTNCQRTIAAKVTEQGGDHVLALKGNQGSLHDDVGTFLDDPMRPAEAGHTTVDGQHGRIETRTSEVSTDIA